MDRLNGRVALVTGAAGGIGRATALRLAAEGASVVVTDIADGQPVVDRITADGGQALFLTLDVADEVAWRDAVKRTLEAFGGLDILVNNAGVGDNSPIEQTTRAEYDRTIAITQTSVLLGMQAAAEALKASGRGSVINISSIFGSSGGFGTSPAYHAAKGAVRTMTKSVAIAWAPEGVRVNSVHPGFVDTAIMDEVRGTEFEDLMMDLTPMGRLGHPDEVAAGVAYLASDDASFVTGSELYIDGGYMAR
jgi:NAD(P)-dependent dehydrogenase (short-subunit alcohol dehydrogenase family)